MGKAKVVKPKFEKQRNSFNLLPQTESQRIYYENLKHDDLVVGVGSAGTGKTFVSCAYAAKSLLKNEFQKVVMTRPVVSMGRTIGLLPGELEEKLEPWFRPMLSTFNLVMGKNCVANNIRNGNIVMQPLEMIRGMSYDNTIVLVDEAQNCTLEELKAISTRIGEHSQLILMGDPLQNDMRGKSGLEDFCDICLRHNITGFSSVKFTNKDIVRSGLVKDLVIAFEKEGV